MMKFGNLVSEYCGQTKKYFSFDENSPGKKKSDENIKEPPSQLARSRFSSEKKKQKNEFFFL